MATNDKQSQDDADFADQFNKEDAPQPASTGEEGFDMFDSDQPSGAAAAGDGATAAAGGADAGAAPAGDAGAAAAPAGPAPDAEAARLKDMEAKLNARAAELDAKEASMSTSNVNEEQAGNTGGDDAGANGDLADPAKALAEDFGQEFVDLLTRFITKICGEHVGTSMGGLSATVDEVIAHLQSERNANHFKAIAAAHGDFNDVVESPEFGAWKAAQPPEDQTRLQHVIDAGSAQEIIDMLTSFKASKGSDADESALDGAEGIRSSGLTLPSAPKDSEDYAAAWNQH